MKAGRGRIWRHGPGQVEVGEGALLDGRTVPIELYARAGARIEIGPQTHVDGGASIEAAESVRIGARCRIGGFVKIMDSHFHPLGGERHGGAIATRAVLVEDDALIGPRAILLPGAHVERGALVPSGAVVRRRFPRAKGA